MSDSDASEEAGWNRCFVKSSGIRQRDLSVYRDESLTDLMFSVVGDKHGAEVASADGTVVMTATVKKAMLGKVEFTNADGTVAATMKKNSILNKKDMEVTLADGAEWTVVKAGGLQQLYSVLENDVPIVRADLKTLPLKRRYPVDIAEGGMSRLQWVSCGRSTSRTFSASRGQAQQRRHNSQRADLRHRNPTTGARDDRRSAAHADL
jgi:hypothetical protein